MYVRSLAFIFLMIALPAHAGIQKKLKPISASLAQFVALTEQLQPGGPQSKWEDPSLPGRAADRKQALNEAGCVYDIPDAPPEGKAGVVTGHLEISGQGCPIEAKADITGSLVNNKIDATFVISYVLKSPASFPEDDVQSFQMTGKFTGTIEGGEKEGYAKIDVTATMIGSGVSRSQGAFSSNSNTAFVVDISGFSFKMLVDESSEFTVGSEVGKFNHVVKTEMFSAEETFAIDGKQVAKEEYLDATNEFRLPFLDVGMGGKPKSRTSCRSELFRRAEVGLRDLEEHVKTGRTLSAQPAMSSKACQLDMIRSAKKGPLEMKSTFRFGRNYLMMAAELKDGGHPISLKPLYAVYLERAGRVTEAGPDHYFLQICEPVTKCE